MTSNASKKKYSEFVSRIKYRNALPPLPFSPKLLLYKIDEEEYTSYKSTEWIRSFPFSISTDNHMGMDINLIDPEVFKERPPLDPRDELLLDEPIELDSTNSAKVNARVSWLRKTEYISHEGARLTGRTKENLEARKLEEYQLDEADDSLETQLEKIENTFEAMKNNTDIKHPSKPDVLPVEVFPILPDINLWPNKLVSATFDNNPIRQTSSDDTLGNHALFSPIQLAGSAPMMLYFLPDNASAERLEKRKIGNSTDESFDYNLEQLYNFKLTKDEDLEKFALVLKPGKGAFYTPITASAVLKKVRKQVWF